MLGAQIHTDRSGRVSQFSFQAMTTATYGRKVCRLQVENETIDCTCSFCLSSNRTVTEADHLLRWCLSLYLVSCVCRTNGKVTRYMACFLTRWVLEGNSSLYWYLIKGSDLRGFNGIPHQSPWASKRWGAWFHTVFILRVSRYTLHCPIWSLLSAVSSSLPLYHPLFVWFQIKVTAWWSISA